MEPFKLRLKIGAHEFEAEGDQETVERQFALWRDLIASTSTPAALPSPPPPEMPAVGQGGTITPAGAVTMVTVEAPYGHVFRYEGEVVSLSVLPVGENRDADAALLVLAGYQWYTKQDLLTGGKLIQGLARSGVPVDRVDRVFGMHMGNLVIRVGANRATRYRLTNPGKAKAEQIIRDLAATVA